MAGELQALAREWVEVRETSSREKSDWEETRATWQSLNSIRQSEIEQLDEFVLGAEERVGALTREKQQFARERNELRTWRKNTEDRVDAVEKSLVELLPRFPAPLRDSLEEPILRLENPDPERALQDRTRDLVLILQGYREFDNSITIDNEVREIDGESREIEVLYLGMSGAWYVDTVARYGGVGIPTNDGWEWREDNAIAGKVRRAISIHRSEEVPGLVELPLPPSPPEPVP